MVCDGAGKRRCASCDIGTFFFPSQILSTRTESSVRSYEKELNGGTRPALRLITTRDTPAGLHMVLCVSDITWSQPGVQVGEDGLPVVPHPTLELTDGWYRLRARVDEILARAVRRGVIRVGRKIAISGASVSFRSFNCGWY